MLPLLRSGSFLQAALLSSYSGNVFSKAPWLHGRYPASQLLWASPTPGQAVPLVIDSLGTLVRFPSPPAGSPRFLDCSFPARCPQPPRKARRVLLLVTSSPMAGFSISGRLAAFNSVTRPNRVCHHCGSQVCLTGFHQTDYSGPLRFDYMYGRAIYMVNSFQLTRSARLILVFHSHLTRSQLMPKR